jgi:cytochrome c oxidase assembly protein subunit 15
MAIDDARSTPWTYRLALATALSAIPLVLFGGSVTTLGAGMAVEGWLIAEGHFLVLFPVESWFRDLGTFVEHTHRLFGVLVGLFAIGACVLAWRSRAPSRVLATVALLAVCGQGALGGFRVLENSPRLAFLHGGLAHGVFALLVASALLLSPGWSRRPSDEGEPSPKLPTLALVAACVVYGQVLLGAWYRHGLRPSPDSLSNMRLAAHVMGAFLVMALVSALAGIMRRSEVPRLMTVGRRIHLLVGAQFVLGFLAWIGFRPDTVGAIEWALSILHVLIGSLLLSQVVVAALECRRHRSGAMASRAPALEPTAGALN